MKGDLRLGDTSGNVPKEDLDVFVKSERRAANLTQAELASKAGVGLRFVRELEQGKRTLRLDAVNKVLKLFGKRLGPINLRTGEE